MFCQGYLSTRMGSPVYESGMATKRTKAAQRTKAQVQDELEASVTGAFEAFATGLGEHVVASNHASLGERPGAIIRDLLGRLNLPEGLLEFFVLYDDHNGSALTVRAKAVDPEQMGAGRVNWLFRHKEVIEGLDMAVFKQRLHSEFRQVEELLTLKEQVTRLEKQVEQERSRGHHRGSPFPHNPFRFIDPDGPYGRG